MNPADKVLDVSSRAPRPASRRHFLTGPFFWFLAAVLLRLLYLGEQAAVSPLFYQPLLDEAEAVETARGLLEGLGFGREPLFKAPWHPLFLAAVMAATGAEWVWVVRLIQHLAGALLVLFGFDVARRCAGPREKGVAGALAAAALAFYGPLIRLENRLVLDFWAVFFQSVMLWALVRMATASGAGRKRQWVLTAGLCAALAWLNRPTLLPVVPFLALWIAGGWSLLRIFGNKADCPSRMYRRLGYAGLFLALPILSVLGFGLRNHIIGGEMLFMPWQGGYNFYHANREGANGRYLTQESFSFGASSNPTRELMIEGYRAAGRGGQPPPMAFGAVNAYWYGLARREIAASPLRWSGLMIRKSLYLLSEREIFNFEDYETQRELSAVLSFAPVGFGFIWPFALASTAMWGFLPRARRRLHGLLWLYGVLLGGAIALFYASGRFRMPLVFPAAVLGAAGCAVFLSRIGSAGRVAFCLSRILPVLVYGMLGAGGIFLSWADWRGVRTENVRHFEYARLSNAFWKNGDPEKALAFAERCEREMPGYPTVSLLRGQALYAMERYDEAASCFEESMRRIPDDPAAPFNLGAIEYHHRDQPVAALRLFSESLRRRPDYHRAAWMAVRAHLRLGQIEQAELLFRSRPAVSASEKDYLIAAILLEQSRDGAPAALESLLQTLREKYGAAALLEATEEMDRLRAGRRETEPAGGAR